MKVDLIRYKTKIGEITGYFVQCGRKFINIDIPVAEFTEIKQENILERYEIDINMLGKIERRLK